MSAIPTTVPGQGDIENESTSIGSLVTLVDSGPPVSVNPESFVPRTRDAATQAWGIFAEGFLRLNRAAFEALGVIPEIRSSTRTVKLLLHATDRVGAVPLKSVSNGKVAGGLVSSPRFGWTGIGSVLSETGWAAMPTILALPSVPGSGREVPSWVISGPVLQRLELLLRNLSRSYREREAVLRRPKGTILWGEYIRGPLSRGHWDRVPCRFPELEADPRLRGMARWTMERVYRSLVQSPEQDNVASELIQRCARLLSTLSDVPAIFPSQRDLQVLVQRPLPSGAVLVDAAEAMSWVAGDRGLGGGRTMDGLPWALALNQLWEAYVEAIYRKEAAMTGAALAVGRKRETVIPMHWTSARAQSLGHLVPDFVLQKGSEVEIVDAKYKAHLAEIDEYGWRNLREEVQAAHRSDIHQVLAYAGLYSADTISATLVYPLPEGLWQNLHDRGFDIAEAELNRGSRHIVLRLRGVPFGRKASTLLS